MVIVYSKVWSKRTTVYEDCRGHRRGAVLADAQVAASSTAALAAVP